MRDVPKKVWDTVGAREVSSWGSLEEEKEG